MGAPDLPAAACREPGISRELFFPQRGHSSAEAKAVCRRCPELEPCRELALEDPWLVGVWGGLTGGERRIIRTRRPSACLDGEPMVDPAPNFDEEPTEVELEAIEADEPFLSPVAEPPSVTCSQCDRPAVAGRPTCGRSECVTEHQRARKRQRYSANPRPRRRSSSERSSLLESSTESSDDSAPQPLAFLRELPDCVVSVELVGGWRCSRST